MDLVVQRDRGDSQEDTEQDYEDSFRLGPEETLADALLATTKWRRRRKSL